MIKTLLYSVGTTILALVLWEMFVKKLVIKTAYEASYEG